MIIRHSWARLSKLSKVYKFNNDFNIGGYGTYDNKMVEHKKFNSWLTLELH